MVNMHPQKLGSTANMDMDEDEIATRWFASTTDCDTTVEELDPCYPVLKYVEIADSEVNQNNLREILLYYQFGCFYTPVQFSLDE